MLNYLVHFEAGDKEGYYKFQSTTLLSQEDFALIRDEIRRNYSLTEDQFIGILKIVGDSEL